MPAIDYLPADVDPKKVRATLALVSDTHMPQRLAALPDALFTLLAGSDLVLHSGDVGELWVLDRLSAIAPVFAVHGNDDTAAAQSRLPYQQIVFVQGQRVLLWHSHYPDAIAERDSRIGDKIVPKLQRSVQEAHACGATLAVFGHWHIPLVYENEGVVVVNPGALASANVVSRTLRQTVAIVWLLADSTWRVAHVDLADTGQPLDVTLDWDAGFPAVMARYSASILDPEFVRQMPIFKERLGRVLLDKINAGILDAARAVWAGEAPLMTASAVLEATLASGMLSADEVDLMRALRDEFREA